MTEDLKEAALDRLTRLVVGRGRPGGVRELERLDELPDRTDDDTRLAGVIEQWLHSGGIVEVSFTMEDQRES